MTAAKGAIQRFFFPSLTPWLVVRIGGVAFFAYLFFGHVCIPFQIQGSSMEPTYTDGAFNFCWRGRYLFSEPRRYDVVTVRFAGTRVMLLKRIVALEGEQVEFRGGKLFVNEEEIEEPYVHNCRNWNLSPRYVEQGCVFVVGDNRGVAIENHSLGQASKQRITGGPLW